MDNENTDSIPYVRTKKQNITILLHRFITNTAKGMVVDHINKNTLDNRKSNLRVVTQSQNAMNQKTRDGQKYKGICFYHKLGKWMAGIKINGKRKHLGYFVTDILAAKLMIKLLRNYLGNMQH